jgi:putative transposase
MRPTHAGLFHVTARSIAEEVIFRDAGDYATGLSVIGGVVVGGLFSCHMVCLMPTHYHVLGSFGDRTLTNAIHKINRRYATKFNRRHTRRGPVFDRPTRTVEITSERHFLEVVRYIALNPDRHETWPYSSYPSLIGLRAPFSFVDASPILDAFPQIADLRRWVDEKRDASVGNPVPPATEAGFRL